MDPAMQEQLLQQLRDIHAPEAIGWWPLAIGWWILLVIVAGAVIGLCFWLYLKHSRDAYRREALTIAEQHFKEYQRDADTAAYLSDINRLLRRILNRVNQGVGAQKVAGSEWVSLLDNYGSNGLSSDAKIALTEHVYQPNPKTNIPALHQELTLWIKDHRRAANV